MRNFEDEARNLRQQEPGGECRHATATFKPFLTEQRAQRYHQETADSYTNVVARLGARHRVVTCKDGLQWILHVAYLRTREALIRLSATLCGRIDPSALAALAALPDVIGRSA